MIYKHIQISKKNGSLRKEIKNKEQLRWELDHTLSAIKCSQKTDLFSVPKIKTSDDISIVYEYIAPAISLGDLLKKNYPEAEKYVIPIVDTMLFLQNKLKYEKTKPLILKGLSHVCKEGVYVHGDFTANNLLVKGEKLVLIDWSSTRWVDGLFNFAPKYWDFIWFIQSIFLEVETKNFGRKEKSSYAMLLAKQYFLKQSVNNVREVVNSALVMEKYFYNTIFKKRSRWYQILKHRNKWKSCRMFWKKVADDFFEEKGL